MRTLYTLVSGSYTGVSDYLKNCIIIIDPCQTPDGHELYTNRYRSSMNSVINPDGNSYEHNQGWPGARTNHYMFDLNRDWTWQTQAETQQRLSLYIQFMPQIHADFHEMGPESTFFFPPIPGTRLSHRGSMSFINLWEVVMRRFLIKSSDSISLKKISIFLSKLWRYMATL